MEAAHLEDDERMSSQSNSKPEAPGTACANGGSQSVSKSYRDQLGRTPLNWQGNVGFTQLNYLTSSPDRDMQDLHRELSAPTDGVHIRWVDDKKHPAFRQLGLFAARPFAAGECLGWYSGVVLPRSKTRASQSRYIFELSGVDLDIDAERFGNEFRFLNCPVLRQEQVQP